MCSELSQLAQEIRKRHKKLQDRTTGLLASNLEKIFAWWTNISTTSQDATMIVCIATVCFMKSKSFMQIAMKGFRIHSSTIQVCLAFTLVRMMQAYRGSLDESLISMSGAVFHDAISITPKILACNFLLSNLLCLPIHQRNGITFLDDALCNFTY